MTLAGAGAPGPGAAAEVPVEELADRVAAAVRTVPGVVGLHGGVFGEVATYLPGRRVSGIRITAERVEVHVTLVWGEPVRATAEVVRDLATELTGLPAFVTVEDVVVPAPTAPAAPVTSTAPVVPRTPTAPVAKEIS